MLYVRVRACSGPKQDSAIKRNIVELLNPMLRNVRCFRDRREGEGTERPPLVTAEGALARLKAICTQPLQTVSADASRVQAVHMTLAAVIQERQTVDSTAEPMVEEKTVMENFLDAPESEDEGKMENEEEGKMDGNEGEAKAGESEEDLSVCHLCSEVSCTQCRGQYQCGMAKCSACSDNFHECCLRQDSVDLTERYLCQECYDFGIDRQELRPPEKEKKDDETKEEEMQVDEDELFEEDCSCCEDEVCPCGESCFTVECAQCSDTFHRCCLGQDDDDAQEHVCLDCACAMEEGSSEPSKADKEATPVPSEEAKEAVEGMPGANIVKGGVLRDIGGMFDEDAQDIDIVVSTREELQDSVERLSTTLDGRQMSAHTHTRPLVLCTFK